MRILTRNCLQALDSSYKKKNICKFSKHVSLFLRSSSVAYGPNLIRIYNLRIRYQRWKPNVKI